MTLTDIQHAEATPVVPSATPASPPSPDLDQTFADLGVIPAICEALESIGIVHPFPIQTLSIPIAILGTDLIGQARTGTGKTLAFGISLLQRIAVPGEPEYDELAAPGKPQALVMCPTRELALQVARDIEAATSVRHARVLTVYGGVGYETQLDTLTDGVDVVVGTPGRLLDLANRRSLDLSHVKVLVLDEADEMLDLGFLPDVERLISKTPSTRQTMLFSATMPSAIVSLARMHLSHPVNIRAESHDAQATVPDITQFVYQAHDLDKPEIIGKLLRTPGADKVMVFCRTKRAVQRLCDDLEDRGFDVTSLHGDLNQVAREKSLKRFRDGKAQVIVATDVAARGIDVAMVSHVINHECPDDEKTYVHRVGRTARAGNTGVAVTLVDWADVTRWKVINKALDLPFTELVESYSTTPQLMADLGIPEGTKGRVPGAVPVQRAPRPERGRGGHDRGHGHDRGGRPERAARGSDGDTSPRPSRVRRRNGVAVAEGADAVVATAPAEATSQTSAEAQSGEATAPRRRRRRRRSGGAGEAGAPSES